MSSCPTLADLLCAMEPECAPSPHDDDTKRHVASCPACQTNLRSFEVLVAAGRVHALSHACDDDARRVVRFRRRLRDERHAVAATGVGSRWWWVAAVIVPLYVVSLGLARLPEPRMTPDRLVDEATRAERAESGDIARRVRIEFKPERRALHATGLWLVRDITSNTWPPSEESGDLRRVVEELRRQNVTGAPLSAASFATWRHGAARSRRDRVTVTADLWILRSEGGAGEPIRSAELMIRRTSYRVVGQAWVIDGVGRLEIAELERRTERVAARLEPHDSTITTATGDWLEAAELRARAILLELELDDAMRVARRGERVSVAGSLASFEQRRALTSALRAVPAVALDLRPATAAPTATAAPDLRTWVARRFDDEAARDVFASRLRGLAESVRRRTIALDLLARRYSHTAERLLSADNQAQVARLADRHVETLHRDLMGLDAYVMAMTGITERCALVSSAPRDWRARASVARPRMERAIEEIEALLAADDLPSGDSWKARATGAFAGAWNEWCQARSVVRSAARGSEMRRDVRD